MTRGLHYSENHKFQLEENTRTTIKEVAGRI